MSDKIATLTMPHNKDMMLRVPSRQKITYSVDEDGIMEITNTIDQYGDCMYGTVKMIISKEAFIEAYNTYIKDIKS